MADYNINAVTRRAVFSGSAGTGPYAFTFEILSQTDLAVYFNAQVLTLTTDYTVTINANGTGSVTIVTGTNVPTTPDSDDQIVIVGGRDIERTTDFVTAGDLRAASLNEQLDSQIIMIQQISEESKRGMRAPVYDPALVEDGGVVDMTLPAKASRAGKTLAFDSDGNPTVGEDIGNWRGDWAASTAYTVRDLVKDPNNSNIYRVNTAHTSSGSAPISTNADSAKWDLVIDASIIDTSQDWATKTDGIVESTDYSSKAYAIGGTGVTNASGKGAAKEWATKAEDSTVDGSEYSAKHYSAKASASASAASSSASSASTSASNASTSASAAASSASSAASAQSAAESARDSALAAYDNFDDRYLGVKSSDPTVDNDGDALVAGSLYFNSVSESMKIYTGSAWVAAYVSGTDFLALAGGTMTGDVTYGDGVKAKFGAGSDLQVYHDGSNSYIDDAGTGELVIRGNGGVQIHKYTGELLANFRSDGNSALYYDGAQKFTTTSGGIDVTGTVTADGVSLGDSEKAQFGAGNDLQIYHDGSNSFIDDAGTGNVFLRGSSQVIIANMTGEQAAVFNDNGAVTLNYDNAQKLATTSYGVDISGSVVADTQTTTGVTGSQTPDMSSYQNFVWTLSGNITLANPTTEKVGQTGFFVFIHSGAARTVSLGTQYRTVGGAGLTLSSTVGAVDFVPYAVRASGIINLGTPQLGFA